MSDEHEADAVDGITLTATDFTVEASEKVSTGQYENYNPSITVEGKLPMAELDEDGRAAVKEQLLRLHGDLQDVLGKAAGNRNAEPEWETWTFAESDGDDAGAEDEAATDGGQPDGQ